MPPKAVTYTYPLRPNVRIRVSLQGDGPELEHSAVTLELEVAENDWRRVVRYDTTGGVAHRDRLKPNGDYLTHRETVRLGGASHQALDNAQQDLRERADYYVDEFRRML
jgi:hypothetical protein